jgi:hypothetical protein
VLLVVLVGGVIYCDGKKRILLVFLHGCRAWVVLLRRPDNDSVSVKPAGASQKLRAIIFCPLVDRVKAGKDTKN